MNSFFEKTNYYALLCLAFSLNFPQNFLKFTLAFWFISSLFVLNFKQGKTYFNKQNIPLLLIGLLLFGRIIVSIIHNDTSSLASKLFETQLTLSFLPLILAFQLNRQFQLIKVLKIYIYGNVVSCVLLIIYFYLFRFHYISEVGPCLFPNDITNYSFKDDIYIFQTYCSNYFKHRAGIGANLSLAIGSIFYLVKKNEWNTRWKKIAISFASILILAVLYATGSRSGLISLFTILFIGVIYLYSTKNLKLLVISFASIVVLLIGLSSLKTTRPIFFNQPGSSNYQKLQNTDPRFKIWESAMEVIDQNIALGVGYSQLKPELFKKYKQNYLTIDLLEKHNTHNQFLQFTLESGIWAGILFGIILLPIYYNRKYIYLALIFSTTFTIYSLLEDSLIIINGVSIFVFFITILISSQKIPEINEPEILFE